MNNNTLHDCGCGCDEAYLHGCHQPDVLLFDEYGGYEEYMQLLAAIKDARAAAEEAREAAQHMKPGKNSVGTEEIQDNSIIMDDLNESVRKKMEHTYDESDESLTIGD